VRERVERLGAELTVGAPARQVVAELEQRELHLANRFALRTALEQLRRCSHLLNACRQLDSHVLGLRGHGGRLLDGRLVDTRSTRTTLVDPELANLLCLAALFHRATIACRRESVSTTAAANCCSATAA
jgi:hypothetical protein